MRLYPLVMVVLSCAAAACVTPDGSNANPQTAADSRVREVDFHHDECSPGAGAKTVDVNGDGRPDIVHVMTDGREVCRMVDLNFDGAVDVFIYYDDKGAERRREADFDRDGRPDQVSIYKDGQLVENDRETNFDDKIDTWDYYQAGALVRRERDSDGDAIIDQWWQFYDPARPKCAIVTVDHNADGKPDADGQVDLCNEGKVSGAAGPGAPAATAAPAAPSGEPAAPSAGAPAVAAPTSSAAAPAPSAQQPSPAPSSNP